MREAGITTSGCQKVPGGTGGAWHRSEGLACVNSFSPHTPREVGSALVPMEQRDQMTRASSHHCFRMGARLPGSSPPTAPPGFKCAFVEPFVSKYNGVSI